jgi:hypothetical protein
VLAQGVRIEPLPLLQIQRRRHFLAEAFVGHGEDHTLGHRRWWKIAFSTSAQYTFSPPRSTMSLARSTR